MTRTWSLRGVLMLLLGLAACGSTPPPPDWQMDSKGALERAVQAYLVGDSRIAQAEFALARRAVAATGQPALVARAELLRCAAQVASLDPGPCDRYDALQADAAPAEQAYAAYLQGQPRAAHIPLLPVPQQAVAQVLLRGVAPTDAAVLPLATEPLARLVAAGVLWRAQSANPAVLQQAVDTASAQGWRRPLLAWLGVQRQRALAAGDAQAAARIARRMDLVAPLAP